ncbi:MAG: protein kinase [Chloroflexi bacterium]|nr:protein kinase [Chloroflexota bacterium]
MQDLSGRQIRDYVLRERLGVGGFAAVYRAYQASVEREVAVKIILPKYANNPDFVRRFETEAQFVARLEHIHIVPLYDYWREPDNAYLVMRWLRGGNLYQSVQRDGPWPLPAATRLVDQIASALAVAHRQGIIHQDITPANVMLDEERNAYLTDFGIARDIIRGEAKTEDSQLYGSPAYMAPERTSRELPMPQTDIYSLGIVLYELITGKLPFDAPTNTTLIAQHMYEPVPPLQIHDPELPFDLNRVILRATAKAPEDRYPDAISMAVDFRQAVGGESGPVAYTAPSAAVPTSEPVGSTPETVMFTQPLAPSNPYKGLRAFEEADAADFFGRDVFTSRLTGRLAGERFLAVVGPSGSGKSSVVKAGLLPNLRQGGLPGSDAWFFAQMVPGAQPFQELETALLSVTFGESVRLIEQLRGSARGLATAVGQILPDTDSEMVLFIDQFEELFTLVEDETERAAFLESLAAAVSQPDSRLRVIITLRADFYDRPLLYATFGQLVRAHTEVVLPLSPDELRGAIIGPANRAGLAPEQDLVAAMVADVVAQPGALPLLQYALTELFEQREDKTLTLAAYRDSGGVLGALARRAEELFTSLNSARQYAVRQLFLRLVNPGGTGEDTRRRIRWAELMAVAGIDRDAMRAVLDAFGQYRLLTFDRDPQTRTPTVEVAHEALIQQWARLQEWLAESRDAIRIQQRLAAATAEWRTAARHPSYLAGGARLAQFETLAASPVLALTEDERAYVTASIGQRERAARLRRWFITALVLLTVLSAGSAAFAANRQRQAEDAREETALERDRAEDARAVAEDERDRADEARQQADDERQNAVEQRQLAEAARDEADRLADIARSRELAALALSNMEQGDQALLLSLEALSVADTFAARNSLLSALESTPHLVAYLHGPTSAVRGVALSPDGTLVAASAADGTILLWDLETR